MTFLPNEHSFKNGCMWTRDSTNQWITDSDNAVQSWGNSIFIVDADRGSVSNDDDSKEESEC